MHVHVRVKWSNAALVLHELGKMQVVGGRATGISEYSRNANLFVVLKKFT